MVVGNTAELGIILPNGEVSFGEMTVAETEWEGESVYVVCVRDIHQRRKAEKALRESEERFRQLTMLRPRKFFMSVQLMKKSRDGVANLYMRIRIVGLPRSSQRIEK